MNFFDFITVPFGYLMQFCCWVFPNYLAALALFTLIIQLILCLIFGIKQQKNSIKQARLAPKVAAIRKKYAGRTDQATAQKMQAEVMQCYQDNGYNQLGGCLPLLIQLPIIMGLYNVIIYPLRYICGICRTDADAFAQIMERFKEAGIITGENATLRSDQYQIINYIANGGENLDYLLNGQTPTVLPSFKIGAFDMSEIPTVASLLVIVPILIFVVMVVTQLITRRFTYQDPMTKEQQNSTSMKIMTYTMPLISVWVSFSMPAAVGVYWIYRSIAATLQQIVLSKLMPYPVYTEEDFKAAERELLSSSKKKKKSGSQQSASGEKKRSLHHIDDDEDESAPLPAPEKKKPDAEEKKTEVVGDPADAPKMKEDKNSRYEKK